MELQKGFNQPLGGPRSVPAPAQHQCALCSCPARIASPGRAFLQHLGSFPLYSVTNTLQSHSSLLPLTLHCHCPPIDSSLLALLHLQTIELRHGRHASSTGAAVVASCSQVRCRRPSLDQHRELFQHRSGFPGALAQHGREQPAPRCRQQALGPPEASAHQVCPKSTTSKMLLALARRVVWQCNRAPVPANASSSQSEIYPPPPHRSSATY